MRFSTEPVVRLLLHVDEVDHDEAGEIAQTHLARGFVGGFEVGLERGLLDIAFARGAAGVHVDGDERFGLVDDDIAAALQRHDRRDRCVELPLDAVLGEDRRRLLPQMHALGVARHQHADEVFGFPVGVVAVDVNFVDVFVVEIADRALHQRAFLVDEAGADAFSVSSRMVSQARERYS